MIIGFDIETDTTTEPYGDGVQPGLDPRVSPITAVAFVGRGPGGFATAHTGDEVWLLGVIGDILIGLNGGDTVATWNGGAFDWPYVVMRAEIHGLTLPVEHCDSDRPHKYDPLPGANAVWSVRLPCEHVDVAYAYKQRCADEDIPWRLKTTAPYFGVEPTAVGDGAHSGELPPAALAAYCASDAHLAAELAAKLTVDELDRFADRC